jgi:hypothetical protein
VPGVTHGHKFGTWGPGLFRLLLWREPNGDAVHPLLSFQGRCMRPPFTVHPYIEYNSILAATAPAHCGAGGEK